MITITPRAADGLREFLRHNDATPEQAVKLFRCCQGGIGMTIAEPSELDQVIRRRGRPLVAVDWRVAELLDQTVLDCERFEEDGQQRIRFQILSSVGRLREPPRSVPPEWSN